MEFVTLPNGIECPVPVLALAISLEARGIEMEIEAQHGVDLLRLVKCQSESVSDEEKALIRQYKQHFVEITHLCKSSATAKAQQPIDRNRRNKAQQSSGNRT